MFLCLVLVAKGQSANESLPDNSVQDVVFAAEQPKTYQAHVAITYHQVAKGENLKRIAQLNDVSEENIRIWNNLNSDHISVGAQLEIRKVEFIPVDEIQLLEPELKIIDIDRKKTVETMANYIKGIDYENTSVSSEWVEAYEQVVHIAEQNFENNIQINKNKKHFWNHISDAANIAFNSVKGWSKSIINKEDAADLKSEILMADNKDLKLPDTTSPNITEPLASEKVLEVKKVSDKELFAVAPAESPVKKKKIWHHVADATSTTFKSVKGWSKSTFGKKEKDNGEPGIFLAENTELILNINPVTKQSVLRSQLTEMQNEPVSPKGNDWKRIYHKVRIGETMTQIALRYNVSKNDIVQWNKLPCDIANVKQRLLIFVPKSFTLAHN